MPIQNINLNARSARVAQKENISFVVVDVGARGGISPEWNCLFSNGIFVGFDPDEVECNRINDANPNVRMYPTAIDASVGKKEFFLTESPYCHGFRRVNEEYFKRFPNYINNKITGSVMLETTSLDAWSEEKSLGHADFLKIDTEGTEADVLSGASKFLINEKCLGVLTEVWFEPDIKHGSHYGFSVINDFLVERGFRLFDISVQRYPRNTLPVGHVSFSVGSDGKVMEATAHRLYSAWGQVLTGDLLYFRDPIAEAMSPGFDAQFWDRDTLIRLMVLLDIYNYQDVAIDILSYFSNMFEGNMTAEFLSALLPHEVIGRSGLFVNIDYDTYFSISLDMFKNMNGGKIDVSYINKPAFHGK